MTRYKVQVRTANWTLTSDTNTPAGPTAARGVVDGLVAGWQIDQVPPVGQPSTVQVAVYDDGTNPAGWLPIDQGELISVYAWIDDVPDEQQVLSFKGRVIDVSATNQQRGGVVFALVCADKLAELSSTMAPPTVTGSSGTLEALYDQVTADAGVTLDPLTGLPAMTTLPTNDVDFTNVSSLDALNRITQHDWREVGATDVFVTYLVPKVSLVNTDPTVDDGIGLDRFTTKQLGSNKLLNLALAGGVWQLVSNPDYYGDFPGSGGGVMVSAHQLAFDVGEWRKTRRDATNTIELTGRFETAAGSGTFVETVRRTFAALVAAFGRNTKTIESPLQLRADAQLVGDLLLMPERQVPSGFGVSQLTVAWELLTQVQKDRWSEKLWLIDANNIAGSAVYVLDVPDQWRLIDTPAIMGRLMGVTWQLLDGTVRLLLQLRALPDGVTDGDVLSGGITSTQLATLVPAVTSLNIDPTITYEQLSMTTL